MRTAVVIYSQGATSAESFFLLYFAGCCQSSQTCHTVILLFGENMLKAGILDRFGFLLLCFVRRDAYPPKKRCCGKTSRHVPAGSIFSLLSYLPAFNFFLKYFLETPSIAPAALANHFPIVL
jgi:hypothetical protein